MDIIHSRVVASLFGRMGLLVLPGCAVLIVLVACLAWRRAVEFLRHRRRRIALGERFFGEPALPIIGNALQMPSQTRDWPEFMQTLSAKGRAAGRNAIRLWVGPRLIVVPSNGEAVKAIVESQTEIKKGPDYKLIIQWLGEALLTSFDDQWRHQRRLLTPTFHFRHLNGYINCFNQQAAKFVHAIAQQMDGGLIALDMYPLMANFTLDIVAGAIMGLDLSGAEREPDKIAYETSIKNMGDLSFRYFSSPLLALKPLWHLFGYDREVERNIRTLREMSKMVIDERLASRVASGNTVSSSSLADVHDKENDDTDSTQSQTVFLDMLLDLHAEGKLPLAEVQAQVDTFMFAGHDTTAHALSWFIWTMACHPEIQDRLHREIVENFPLITDPHDQTDLDAGDCQVKSIASLNELRYLDQCVKETLRMFAPVPIVQRVTRQEIVIDGEILPSGSSISICPMIIHYNEEAYPNPDVFNPDNFLPERSSQRHPYDFIPFSAGPRNCIGQRFAMTVIKVFVVHFFQRYRISTHIPFHDNRPRMETMYVPDLGVPVTVYRR